jgi:hypothetical protein
MYVLTFDAQRRYETFVAEGRQSYHVAAKGGVLDVKTCIDVCRILAARAGTLLLPENGVDIQTVDGKLRYPPLWDDAGVTVY